jgi:hypothetical protein
MRGPFLKEFPRFSIWLLQAVVGAVPLGRSPPEVAVAREA